MKRLENMDEIELAKLMSMLANGLEYLCEKLEVEKPLFCLLLFNDPGIAQYIGNCQRSHMIAALRETADRLELREDVTR